MESTPSFCFHLVFLGLWYSWYGSSTGNSDGSWIGKNKQKLVRPKNLLRLSIGDGVSMAESPSFAERALVGHAWGRKLSVGFLK